jgi:hypothetical protein
MTASPLMTATQTPRCFRFSADGYRPVHLQLLCRKLATMHPTNILRYVHQEATVISIANEPLATSSWPTSDVRSRPRAAKRTTSVHRLARSSRSNLGKVACCISNETAEARGCELHCGTQVA